MGEAGDELTPSAEQIERRIEAARDRLTVRLSQIEERTREVVSLRRHVADRPWVAMASAAGIGLALGLMHHHRRRERDDD